MFVTRLPPGPPPPRSPPLSSSTLPRLATIAVHAKVGGGLILAGPDELETRRHIPQSSSQAASPQPSPSHLPCSLCLPRELSHSPSTPLLSLLPVSNPRSLFIQFPTLLPPPPPLPSLRETSASTPINYLHASGRAPPPLPPQPPRPPSRQHQSAPQGGRVRPLDGGAGGPPLPAAAAACRSRLSRRRVRQIPPDPYPSVGTSVRTREEEGQGGGKENESTRGGGEWARKGEGRR